MKPVTSLHTLLKRWPTVHMFARSIYRGSPPVRELSQTVVALMQQIVFGKRRYIQILPNTIESDPTGSALFNSVWKTYARSAHLSGDPLHADGVRIVQLFNLVMEANKLSPGDYIELGSHRGFTLRAIHKFMDSERTLYSLDTFEGFDQKDIDAESTLRVHNWGAGSFQPTSPERVAHYVGDGTPPQNLKIIKGWFPDSFKGLEDRRWRFVHVDFDLYQPIKAALETLWEPLLPGGVALVHDYGCLGFPGAKVAVDEFCSAKGIAPVVLADRWGTVALRKPVN